LPMPDTGAQLTHGRDATSAGEETTNRIGLFAASETNALEALGLS
jgi:hypothetical protein